MPSISSSSWNVSGVHLRVRRGNRPSERTIPVKILPRTLKQRSSPHGMSSVTSGKERQSLRIHSTSGILGMIARGETLRLKQASARGRGRSRHTSNVLHLIPGFSQHHRHLQLLLAPADGYFYGIPGAMFVHDLGEDLLALNFLSVDGDD